MTSNREKILNNLMTHYVDSTLVPVDTLISKTGKSIEIRLAYGETYDAFGLTLDSLKYYFFLSVLASLFKDEGYSAKSTVIVGDVASIRNKNVDKEAVQKKTEENIHLLSKIRDVYALPLDFTRMSSIFKTDEFKKTLKLVQSIYEQDAEMQRLAASTVMRNRIKQENEAGFLYSLEEVTLIVDTDIKVGAKREVNYDKMANIVKNQLKTKPLQGVYLKPTYPLGVQFDYFLQHPDIEKYGLTPYKAGSNKMQEQRVIIGETTISELKNLVQKSFYHKDMSLPNAVRELYLIGLLAKAVYSKDIAFLSHDGVFDLPSKDAVIGIVEDYIYKPLGLE